MTRHFVQVGGVQRRKGRWGESELENPSAAGQRKRTWGGVELQTVGVTAEEQDPDGAGLHSDDG